MIEDTSEPYEANDELSSEHREALDRLETAADWMEIVLNYLKRTKQLDTMEDKEYRALEEVVTALEMNYKL
jgi:hypothetical protein